MRHAAAVTLAREALATHTPVAWITVAAVRGSAPREAGACMCVTAESQAGSIGGGTLEYKAIASARELLLGHAHWLHQPLALGPALGQCCGGRVELLLERLHSADLHWLEHDSLAPAHTQLLSHFQADSRRKTLRPGTDQCVRLESLGPAGLQLTQPLHPGHFHVLMFGAGHLGRALAPLLATLPCTVHWIDARETSLPAPPSAQIRTEWLEAPTLALQDAPSGSLALVMTHNHAMDFDIAAAALANPRIAWVGLIGSRSKRRQFERHVQRQPTAPSTDRLACPIGASSAELRAPHELAIILASALLQARGSHRQSPSESQHHA